jgi:dCMP deaminase
LLARHIAGWSRDPSTKVGAVIVGDRKQVLSLGFNGLPMGVEDSPDRLEDRETKYKLIVHAEMNALAFADRSVAGSTLYTWPFMPCSRCAGIVIQRGVGRIVAPYEDNPRWNEDFKASQMMFTEAGVELKLVTLDWTFDKDTGV